MFVGFNPGQLSSLLASFSGVMPAALDTLEDTARTIRKLVVGKTPVGISSTAGTMKGSWSSLRKASDGFSFDTRTPYAHVLEEGLYPGVGSRTVQTGGGIFSRQAPSGMATPILADSSLEDQIASTLSRRILGAF